MRLSRGEVVDLLVTAEGHGERRVHHCLAGGRVVVSFSAGAEIELVARDESGNPVAGAEIVILGQGGADSALPPGTGSTGQDGRTVITGLSPGTAVVLLVHTAFATPEAVTVTVPASGRVRAEFVLARGALSAEESPTPRRGIRSRAP